MSNACVRTDIEWADYCQMSEMNPSTLVAGFKSMLHLKRTIDGEVFKETDKMRFGHRVHCLLLEPERFEAEHVVMPSFHLDDGNVTGKGAKSTSKATAYYKEQVALFESENAGREIISRQDYDKALHMIEAVRSNDMARAWLEAGETEVTVLGEILGVPFRGRIDLLADCIVDLKNTNDATPRLFGNIFARFRYAEKLSIYRELVRQAMGNSPDVWVVAQEDNGDFDTVVYRVPEIVLDMAFEQVVALVERYKDCRECGVWPGLQDGMPYLEIAVPNWAMPENAGLDWSDV